MDYRLWITELEFSVNQQVEAVMELKFVNLSTQPYGLEPIA